MFKLFCANGHIAFSEQPVFSQEGHVTSTTT